VPYALVGVAGGRQRGGGGTVATFWEIINSAFREIIKSALKLMSQFTIYIVNIYISQIS
jgi:hypothetical protein